ncbi:MAG: endonuclease/exonuclease/phosphatase family protein [Armatimonadetes bacterium]|nr:endonuclease/exonuclease/phosphatase family protein [Armatimonadota bacterium]
MARLLVVTLRPPISLNPHGSDDIVIASWNIGFEPLESRIDDLIDAFKRIDADLILVVELTPYDAAKKLQRELASAGMRYQYSIAEKRELQNLCVLYRDPVKVSDVRAFKDVNLGSTKLRTAYTAHVQAGKFDFALIGVHNKSKRKEGPGQDTEGMRIQQLQLLRDEISRKLSGSEKDLLLIGDYNMIRGDDQEQYDILNSNANLAFLTENSPKDAFTYIFKGGQKTSFIDGYGIAKGNTEREYVAGSFQVVPLHEHYYGRGLAMFHKISDHLPTSARFKITGDDD